MKIEAIYLDMDGVLADFVTPSLEVCDIPLTHDDVNEWNYFEPYLNEAIFWHRIESTYNFWLNLNPYDWADNILSLCKLYDAPVFFCSAPPEDPSCASQKLQWLRKHCFMGKDENNYVLTNHKELLAKPGCVLIDDSDKNISAFIRAGGIGVTFPQKWNTLGQSVWNDSKYEYVERSLNGIAARYNEPAKDSKPAVIRSFETGATRNIDTNKLDFEGFLSPTVLESFAEYMHGHRTQKDGTVRDSDNWQKGIPIPVYMKSMFRHFFDVWKMHRGLKAFSPDDGHELTMEEGLNAMLFNVQGYQHEHLKQKVLSNA